MTEKAALSQELLQKICLEGWPRDQTVKAIMADFIDVARRLTGSDYGSIYILEREDDEVRVVSAHEEGELLADLPNLLELDKESPGIITWVYQNNQSYLSNDVRDDPYYFPAFKGTQANLAVPIKLQGAPIGVLSVESVYLGHYGADDQGRLEDLAGAVSVFVSRQWLTEYSRRRGYNVEIVGISKTIRRIEALVKRVAPTREPVLLTGESGVGKELLAHAIHYFSKRRDDDLLIVNCGAFAEELLTSELFGHVRGSFTGAHRDKAGKFELADGGTLFLDEVESMSPRLQVMLLRVLEHGEVQKVGEDRGARRIDVRIIAASNQELSKLVEDGAFRDDLYYRLNVFDIRVPALRSRVEDIPLLADHFLRNFRRENGGGPSHFAVDALERLASYPWPGNVRELRNVVHRAAVLSMGEEIRLADLPAEVRRLRTGEISVAVPFQPTVSVDEGSEGMLSAASSEDRWSLDRCVADHLRRVLIAAGGNKTRAAELLGIPRTSLYHKLRKYGLGEA
ncbi:MAG: sigma 54-interacting transcriptional regulator [Acidobacteriota bacterium]